MAGYAFFLFATQQVVPKRCLIVVQTAGLVVAAKLSEDSDVSVLVLEAGPANLNDPRIRAPGIE